MSLPSPSDPHAHLFSLPRPSRSDSYSSAEAGVPDDPTLSALLHNPPSEDEDPRSRSPPPKGGVGMGRSPSGGPGLSTPNLGGGGGGIGGIGGGEEGLSVKKVGKAIMARGVRAARRGNLPFLIVFLSCLFIFFSALAGIGYVDPDTLTPVEEPEFRPGSPVFDPADDEGNKKREELRELEKSWSKKKRPKDGAWMQKQRDDKAIRRVRPAEPSAVAVVAYDDEQGNEKRDVKDGDAIASKLD